MNIISHRQQAKNNEERYYSTGKYCKNNHLSKRLTSTGQCVDCLKVRDTKIKNDRQLRDNKNLANNVWRKNNPDKVKAYAAKHYSLPENRLKRSKRNKEFHNKYKTEDSFLLKKRTLALDWQVNNKERSNVIKRNRRAKLRNSEGKHNMKDILIILENQKWLCAEPTCNKNIKNNQYHVDHIMPIYLGGSNDKSNLQCLCVKCNLSKSYKHPIDWANENGRLL